MKELKSILAQYEKAQDQPLVLATVISVEGSSYRRPGARMLIQSNGEWTGSVSGGCLEGDVLRKSRSVLKNGLPTVVSYDTSLENSAFAVNLGCEGVISILLEPVLKEKNPLTFLSKIANRAGKHALCTVVRSELNTDLISQKAWMNEKNEIISEISDSRLSSLIEIELSQLRSDESSKMILSNDIDLLIETFEPPINLLIFGGGMDAKPVVSFAHLLGWNVQVYDDCIAKLLPVNFPNTRLCNCSADQIAKEVTVQENTAAVLLSHNYKYDFSALEMLLKEPTSYIGILGPQKKMKRMIHELMLKGIELSTEDRKRIYGPVGLDIGAETADEIALSIISEIKAHFSNRNGGSLKHRNQPIHSRPENGHIHLDLTKSATI